MIRAAVLALFTAVIILLASPIEISISYAAGLTIIRVPEDYATIQSAINAASSGDIIVVSEGTYAEGSISVHRRVTLIANGTVIVDGLQQGNVFSIYANNVTVKGFTIRNSKFEWPYCGIQLIRTRYCVIEGNNLTNNYYGIELYHSISNTITGNNVTNNHEAIELFCSGGNNITGNNVENNWASIVIVRESTANNIVGNNVAHSWYGVWLNASSGNGIVQNNVINNRFGAWLWESETNVLRYNNLTDNEYNFGVWGLSVSDFIHDIDTSNLVNGKPIYYLINQKNLMIDPSTFPNVGFLAVINSTDISVKNLTLTNNIVGLSLVGAVGLCLQNLNLSNNFCGALLVDSQDALMVDNFINNNEFGIRLYNSGGNFLRNNKMTGNHYSNFEVHGQVLSDFLQDIDVSNLVDGKPIYYLVNESGKEIPSDAGYVAAVNCTNITVQNLNLKSNGEGMLLAYTTNSTIQNNNITNNFWHGIWLWYSRGNTVSCNAVANTTWYGIELSGSDVNSISGNTVANNWYGVSLSESGGNAIYHNNFINNTYQVSLTDSADSSWDDGYPSGGNHWSDYTGLDEYSGPDQDQPGGDGIGDTPHIIGGNNQDNYPLMSMFSDFAVDLEDETYHVTTICNSTISGFRFNASQRIISFNVTGEEGIGFCRVSIPTTLTQDLWEGNCTVLVDGQPPPLMKNWTDRTNTYLYFTYQHSIHEVVIIPEFSSFLIPLLLIITTLMASILKKYTIDTECE